jgi:peptidylprolyl isomerase
MARTIKAGDTIALHYTGTLDDGSEFDSSRGSKPLSFRVGAGQVIPGFDAAVMGMEVGASKVFTIPAEEAYGPYVEELVQEVPRTDLPEDFEPIIGMQVQAQSDTGEVAVFTITELDDEIVTLDANHELAGETLTFDIKIVSIS